tara:strand:+ start:207 stop:1508 length:1302 start_codon:yes stop_codon:yes gene_type:complete
MPDYSRLTFSVPTPDQRIGFSGMTVYGNRSYAAGDEWLTKLTNTQRDRFFRTILDNVGVVAVSSRLMANLMAQVVYTIVPADDTPEAIDDALLMDTLWRTMEIPWSRVVAEIGRTAPMWGWSFHEAVYKKDDSGLSIKGLYLIRQDSRYLWHWEDDGRTVTALEQMTRSGQHATIPLVKGFHFVPDTSTGDPEGCPILRNLYPDYIGYVNSTTAMDVGVKKDATGSLVATVPVDIYTAAAGDQSIGENAAATTLLKSVQSDTAGFQNGERSGFTLPGATDSDGKPTGWGITMLQGAGARQFNALENARFYQNNMLTAMLTQFLGLGAAGKGGMGSQGGLSASQTELLDLSLGGMLDNLCDAVTTQVIRPLAELRGMSTVPRMTHGPIRPPDLMALAQALGVAVKAGMVSPSPEIEAWILDLFGAPAKTAKGDL